MASTIKVNNIQNQCGANIANKCGSTITLGASGDTITLACGASQTGFGRTGTVDWDTTAKTASFTAVSGNGYFVNTTSGAITVTLPATPSAGDIVSIADYTNTFQTNSVTVARNGSPIGGVASDALLSTEGQSVTFIYVDGTEGWKNVQDSTSNVTGNPFIVATGGTITTCGNCKIHTFTGPGTFTVCSISTNCAAENIVSYMVVAGGGAGGGAYGGGGGAGGYREVKSPVTPYTASPLDGYSTPTNRITVTAQAYPIIVGGGGAGVGPGVDGDPDTTYNGSNSIFSTITSAGGGTGRYNNPAPSIGSGGSGGGGDGGGCGAAGTGNTPPVSPPQGNNGGSQGGTGAPNFGRGGGGGAGAVGSPGTPTAGGAGGAGTTSSINATPTTRAGGGGGGVYCGPATGGAGGSGGGGAGSPGTPQGVTGTTNTGGGGGGSSFVGSARSGSGNGGSGIVVIRYKYK